MAMSEIQNELGDASYNESLTFALHMLKPQLKSGQQMVSSRICVIGDQTVKEELQSLRGSRNSDEVHQVASAL